MKLIMTLFLAGTLTLGGCATPMGGLNTQQQVALVMTKCPVLKKYSKEELREAAAEIKNLPSKSQISVMINDYGKLRDACRVITKKLQKVSK